MGVRQKWTLGVCLAGMVLAPTLASAAGANANADTYVSSTSPGSNLLHEAPAQKSP